MDNPQRSKQQIVRLAKFITLTMVLLLSAMPMFAILPWQHHGSPAPSASPSHQSGPPPSNAAPDSAAGSQNSSRSYYFQPKGPGPHRGDWLRKYGTLPPSEQERKLQSDPNFRNLPPEKQNHLMNSLRKFNSQPPEKKQQILNRMETYEHMTPQQQQQARSLFDRYRNLPEDQKNRVSQAYKRLRGMPPSARNDVMNSDEFRNGYTDEEKDLLRGMTDLNVGPSR
jgi:hypothetical protein